MSEPLFKESQRFRQPWLFVLLIIINIITLYPVIMQVVLGNELGNNPKNNGEYILLYALTIGISALLFVFRLDTEIRKEGISARLFPLHRKFRRFAWADIQQTEVREYKPIREYGGWGIRFGKNGKAWNISGNKGIQLVFQNGKKLLIGTNRPEEAKKVLDELNLIPDSSD